MLGKLHHIYSVYRLHNSLTYLKDKETITNLELNSLKESILNGGCLNIKFAQWFISKLKSNKDENSKRIVTYFEDIFEQCPKHYLKHTLSLFEKDFNLPLEHLVRLNTVDCIASGSVGQVYKCKLNYPIWVVDTSKKEVLDILNENKINISFLINDYWLSYEKIPDNLKKVCKKIEYIALKVKHPKINEDIEYTISCVNILTSMQNYSYIKNLLGLHVDFKDFIDNLSQQINFYNEYKNSFIFRKNFAGNYLNYFPRVLWCTENILITEYCESKSMMEFSQYNQLKACLNFGCAISKMILVDNFCHGDIHEKNWGVDLYNDDNIKDEPRLIFYDYGICFKSDSIDLNRKLWEYFEDGNIEELVNISKKLIVGDINDDDIKDELNEIVIHFKEYTLDIVNLMHNINKVLERHNCKLSSMLLNLVLVLSLIDSTLKKHNLIGSNGGARVDHYVELRDKGLDMIAYCNSKGIYKELVEYMKGKRKRLAHKISSSDFGAFKKNLCLDLDLPE